MLEMKGDPAEGHSNSTHILTHDSDDATEGLKDGVMVGGGERACAAAARLTTSKTKAAATAVAVWRGRFSEKLSPVVCPSIGEREKPLEKDKRERERVSE